jgi:hypothetical protein
MFIVYKTTNTVNGKIYIGVHGTSSTSSHRLYLGSGKLLKVAIKKHGRDKFTREILFSFDNLEQALLKEKELVNDGFIERDDTYNLTIGGSSPPNSKEWWTEEHSKAASLRLKNNTFKLGKKESPETKSRKSISMKNSITQGRWERTEEWKSLVSDRGKKKFENYNPMNNEISRKKVSESKIGRRKIISTTGISKYVRPDQFNDFLNQGYRFVI